MSCFSYVHMCLSLPKALKLMLKLHMCHEGQRLPSFQSSLSLGICHKAIIQWLTLET